MTFNNFSWDPLSEEDKYYFKALHIEGIMINVNNIFQKDLNHQDFINQSIQIFNQFQLMEDK